MILILLKLIKTCFGPYSLSWHVLHLILFSYFPFFPHYVHVFLKVFEHIYNIYYSWPDVFVCYSINSVISRSASIDWLFSWLWVTFSSMSTYLILLYWMFNIVNVTLLTAGSCSVPLKSVRLCSDATVRLLVVQFDSDKFLIFLMG